MYELPKLRPEEIIAYHRKSRKDDPSASVEDVLAQHRRIVDEWVLANIGAPLPEENIYMERVSGETISDRPKMQEVLRRIESPYVKAVVVVEPQRLSRGDLEDAGHIINIFRYSGTLILSPRMNYDLALEADRMFLEMELKQGNQYLEYTKRILARGRQDSLKRGNYLGPEAPFGYDKMKNSGGKGYTLIPNKDAPIVRGIYEMYSTGKRPNEIEKWAVSMGSTVTRRTIGNILRNPVYTGKTTWGKVATVTSVENGQVVRKKKAMAEYQVFEGNFEPIISQELYDKVQKTIGSKPRINPDKILINPFSGLIHCGHCGHALRRTSPRKNTKSTKKFPGTYVCIHCNSIRKTFVQDLYDYVITAIEQYYGELVATGKPRTNPRAEWQARVDLAKERIADLEKKEVQVWEDRYSSANRMPESVFTKIATDLRKDIEAAQNVLEELLREEPKGDNPEVLTASVREFLDQIAAEDMPIEQQNRFFKVMIREIVIEMKENGEPEARITLN